jgi:hypothetical protein
LIQKMLSSQQQQQCDAGIVNDKDWLSNLISIEDAD